jgi:hypothetical protein
MAKKPKFDINEQNIEAYEQALKSEICMRDPIYFIENFVYIEDRDSTEIAIPFTLWEKQKECLLSIHNNRLNDVLKARQLGLTWLVLAYSLWCELFNAGFVTVALSKRETDAQELTRRKTFMLKFLPQWMITDAKLRLGGKTYNPTTMTITYNHPEKEPSMFRSLSASPDSGRSLTGSLVILDEWAFQEWARDIWSAAFPTINRPTGGKLIGLSTGKRGTLFEEIWNGSIAKTNTFVPFFLPWWSDPRRDDAWYEKTRKSMPNTYRAEYPATPEEAFMVGEGSFFEEWREDVHVIDNYWEPQEDNNGLIIGSYDPGFSTNACFKWYYLDRDENSICFREYYPHRTTDIDQCLEIKRMSRFPSGKPYSFHYIVADSNAWVPSRSSGESTFEIFANNGLPMRQADKNLENGWRRTHEWLSVFPGHDGKLTARLRFTPNCMNTRRTYPSCICGKSNPEDVDKSCESHPQDVDRYFVMSRPRKTEESFSRLKELEDKWGKHSKEYEIWAEYASNMDDIPENELNLSKLGY